MAVRSVRCSPRSSGAARTPAARTGTMMMMVRRRRSKSPIGSRMRPARSSTRLTRRRRRRRLASARKSAGTPSSRTIRRCSSGTRASTRHHHPLVRELSRGRRQEQKLALAFEDAFCAENGIFKSQFASVGDIPKKVAPRKGSVLSKEASDEYKIWCSGRRFCQGALITLKLKPSNDLYSAATAFQGRSIPTTA